MRNEKEGYKRLAIKNVFYRSCCAISVTGIQVDAKKLFLRVCWKILNEMHDHNFRIRLCQNNVIMAIYDADCAICISGSDVLA